MALKEGLNMYFCEACHLQVVYFHNMYLGTYKKNYLVFYEQDVS